MDKFFEILSCNPDKVCYGPKSVDFALSNNAIEILLISDKLFRSKNVATRKNYVKLIEQADRDGIKTVIFSSMNPSGESILPSLFKFSNLFL